MKLFSGTSNKPLAEKVAKELGIELSPVEVHTFPDGEKRIRVIDHVVDEETVVIQPTSTPAPENYMELFFIIDALQRSGAKSLTVVIPYLGYQRQDHVFRDGEAVSLDVIVKMLEALKINKIIAFDLHTIRIVDIFNTPIAHLSALPIFAEKIKKEGWNKNNTVLVSPDMGGIRRIKQLSALLDDMPFGAIEKDRNLATGEVSVEGAHGLDTPDRAIIVDDMISSGGTIALASGFLKGRGVKEIYVFATHAVFSESSKKILQEAALNKVFVADTLDIPEDRKFPKLEVLSVAPAIAKELRDN